MYRIYISIETLYPFFSADPRNSVRLDGERCCTAIFRSLQRCSNGFKSGLWLGHSWSFRDMSRNHDAHHSPLAKLQAGCHVPFTEE